MSKRTRFYPTPAWLIAGLLAVECVLWLSERFSWFALNQHKGWTVLVAVASVGIALVFMLFWFAAALVFRWRFQFSIRSLLLLVVAVTLPCSWLATQRYAARKQAELAYYINHTQGGVNYDWQFDANFEPLQNAQPPVPHWLQTLLGIDFFSHIVIMDFDGPGATDDKLDCVDHFTHLRYLTLSDTQVTDRGLNHLSGLTSLTWLNLDGTPVTDEGLPCLYGLTQLETIVLRNTRVTDAGVAKVRKALPHCEIER